MIKIKLNFIYLYFFQIHHSTTLKVIQEFLRYNEISNTKDFVFLSFIWCVALIHIIPTVVYLRNSNINVTDSHLNLIKINSCYKNINIPRNI